MTANGAAGSDRRTSISRRRFVAATGASGLAVGLAGCGDIIGGGGGGGTETSVPETGTTTGTTDGGGTGTTVTWGFDPVAVPDDRDAIRQALHDSGLSDDVRVEFTPGDEDTEQRRADYDQLLSDGEQRPDLLLMNDAWVDRFVQREQIRNLSEILTEEQFATIDEEYFDELTATTRDHDSGDLYGVPIAPEFGTMQYRLDLVERAGYSPVEDDWATEPMSWERWSHVTADAYDLADVEYGFTTQWDIYQGTACCSFNEVMSSWGGAYFGDRENRFGPVGDRPITVDAEPVVRSLNMMRTFVHDEDVAGLSNYAGGFTPTDVLGWQEEGSREPFARGDAVMHRNWPYSIATAGQDPAETDEAALGDDLGVMPIPYAVSEAEAEFSGTGGTTAALGGRHVTVNPHTQNEDAVAQVLEAVMTPDFQLELFRILGWLPPRPELFDSSSARDVPVIGEYLDTLRVAGENAKPRPVTSVWNDEASVIAQDVNRAVGREVTSEEAMSSLRTSLEGIESGA